MDSNDRNIDHSEPYTAYPKPPLNPSNYAQPQAPVQPQVSSDLYPAGPAGFPQAPVQPQVSSDLYPAGPTPPLNPANYAQPQIPVQPQASPAMAQNDQYTTYRTTLQADINVPKDGEKTLSWVHRNQKKASLITTVLVILVSSLNVFYAFHVMSIRHKNKVAYLAAGGSYLDPKAAADQVKNDNGPNIENRPDGTLDMSHKISASYNSTPASQNIKTTGLNQQINLYNGLSMMITSVQKNPPLPQSMQDELQNSPLASGYGYVRVNMIIGNRNQSDAMYVSLYNLSANVDGAKVNNIIVDTSYGNDHPFGSASDLSGSNQIDSNKTLSGAFYIKVPLSPLPTITYEAESVKGSDNKSLSLIGEFKLQ